MTINLIANLQFKNLEKDDLQDHQSHLVGPNCNQQGANKWEEGKLTSIQNKQYIWLL